MILEAKVVFPRYKYFKKWGNTYGCDSNKEEKILTNHRNLSSFFQLSNFLDIYYKSWESRFLGDSAEFLCLRIDETLGFAMWAKRYRKGDLTNGNKDW